MKGILGRKVGMTQLFTDNGKSIAVSVVEVQPNVVTSVFTKEKDGYVATQLATGDKRDKVTTKPMLGHFKKAGTNGKYFVKEVRGMEGHAQGDVLNVSLFEAGELVDVTGTSKGKGFQGNIKRHNQHIGPKSHGGGGGSQPVRQTGSLGDMVSNRVFKGMTMPGHMGAEQVTVQNLEVIAVDLANNALLIKGSIPGARKGFVVVKEAVKGLPSHEAKKLVDVKEAHIKNELLEEAKKAGADVNTEMSVEEMKAAITAAAEAKEAEAKAKAAEEEAAKLAAEEAKVEAAAEKAHEEAELAKASGDEEAAAKAEAKAEALDKQAESIEAKVEEAKAEAKEAKVEAAAAEAKAEELQVEVEEDEEEVKGDA